MLRLVLLHFWFFLLLDCYVSLSNYFSFPWCPIVLLVSHGISVFLLFNCISQSFRFTCHLIVNLEFWTLLVHIRFCAIVTLVSAHLKFAFLSGGVLDTLFSLLLNFYVGFSCTFRLHRFSSFTLVSCEILVFFAIPLLYRYFENLHFSL